MIKRRISEYSTFVLLIFGILLIFMRLYVPAIFVFVIWYCLYGMVGLAFTCSIRGNLKLSNFFLYISVPMTLMPFRKSFYYWTKAVNVLLLNPAEVSEAYEIAQKVNVEKLYTDNNRSFFIVALLNDLGEREKALEYMEMAEQIPHKESVDLALKKIREEVCG